MKIDLYSSSKSNKAQSVITVSDYINGVINGRWLRSVIKVRESLNTPNFKKLKNSLPAVTISSTLKSRLKGSAIEDRLIAHSGFICIDIDKKDNKDLRTSDLIDKHCLAQFVSVSGEGLKIIYRCKKVHTAEEHRRIYDACAARLVKLGRTIKIDPIVKSIASLQYVSYDNNAFVNWNTKLVIEPLPPKPKKESKRPLKDNSEIKEQLDDYIKAAGKLNVTSEYEDWLKIGFGLAHSLGEDGREYYHLLSKNYKGYSKSETDEKFSGLLESTQNASNAVTIASVFGILNDKLPKSKVIGLMKKWGEVKHATGIGEGVDVPELNNMVAFGLFLFKKKFAKNKELMDLELSDLNLNAFDKHLNASGYFRYKERFVKLTDSILDVVDVNDILYELTKVIESAGHYAFTYSEVEYTFKNEELLLLWRRLRAKQDIRNQIFISLKRYEENILKDEFSCSYIPYLNGIVKVDKSGIELLPYNKSGKAIWRERILQRNFKLVKSAGHFEKFFNNVLPDKDSRWYLGYMLHNRKLRSLSRAWLLYDKITGNNGRTGKTIIGTAIGHIRNVVTIDGKTIDFKNRFYLQQVQPWTDILFIDDPSRYMSLNPLFNTITGKTTVDRKNREPIDLEDLKVMLASNWFVESEGKSESGRQFVSQLNPFYHSDKSLTPIKDAHGNMEFFYEWKSGDWNQFDSFMMRAIHFYFSSKAPDDKIISNVKIARFIQIHDKELYYNMVDFVKHNIVQTRDKLYAINQQLFVSMIIDNSELKRNGAGRAAREFLSATTDSEVTISSNVGGKSGMFYVFKGAPKFSY